MNDDGEANYIEFWRSVCVLRDVLRGPLVSTNLCATNYGKSFCTSIYYGDTTDRSQKLAKNGLHERPRLDANPRGDRNLASYGSLGISTLQNTYRAKIDHHIPT